ncbi:PREDICTED: non-functional pseudokinase ZED1-like [Tarenaya hassleriana]|uniref:non-functional pseudokinase ZED1-like n=1 Tax=Tarenaya hassleriana TaxID=28532 RepID=UPI00053C2D58|nr:PREDICTED: non-functional pseudokinase ZED1-like [Tarenaya hassleriana]
MFESLTREQDLENIYLAGGSMNWWKRRSLRRKKEDKRQKPWFLETGSAFLEELIADCNGKSNPIRMFSSNQILGATDNFDSSCYVSDEWNFTWFRGVIDDRVYAIKVYHQSTPNESYKKKVYNDIVISIRVSNHGNFLKVLGCCLEFPLPVLLHEYPDNGALHNTTRGSCSGDAGPLLPWNLRVKIAKEIAYAAAYLHKAFPRIIIHRDIKPSKIFLDKNWTAKLTDFSVSISLPEGKSRAEDVIVGTYGYIDSRYMETGVVAKSSDVFGFGTFLTVLLTGRPDLSIDEHSVWVRDYLKSIPENGAYTAETMDRVMTEEMTDHQRPQVEEFRKLALRCCEDAEDDRPTMIQVAKELKQIETSLYAATRALVLLNRDDSI